MINPNQFDYNLPEELIAREPVNPRDSSRLLVYDSGKKEIKDNFFSDLPELVQEGDLIVLNESKVFPARLIGQKKSGGKIEILLIEKQNSSWLSLIGGKIKQGETVHFSNELVGTVISRMGKEATISFNVSDELFWNKIEEIGKTPIPPYIKGTNLEEQELRKEYQTVYAKKYGSAAAPTAGLHFTDDLIQELKKRGVNFASVNLHVGLGTFAPLEEKNIIEKKLHKEFFSIPATTSEQICRAKKCGKKVIAIGTTTVRALESGKDNILSCKGISSETEIFIQPGYQFDVADALITNFHLPKSSLMMLVAAFIENKGFDNGRDKLLEIYNNAIENKYRFYSFGDAMMII